MNAQELEQAGFGKEEIAAYYGRQRMELKTAGFSDAEIDARYGPTPASPPNPAPAPIDDFFNVGLEGVPYDPVDGVPHQAFSEMVQPWVKPWQAVGYSTAESLNRGMATFATHLDTLSEYIEKKTGMQKGGFFKEAAKQYNENTEYWKKRSNEVGITFFQELISEAVGGAVPGITEFLLNVPYAALLGAAEAEKAGENEVGAALLKGAKRGILGAVFHSMGPLQQYLRAPTMGAVFGAQTAMEGGDSREIAKAAGTGALYSLVSPGGRYGLNELKENARSYFEKDARRIEELRTGTEPPQGESVQPEPTEGVATAKTEGFTPTHEWQEVPKDAVLPSGLEIKMDMEAGKSYARVPEGENVAAFAPKADFRRMPEEGAESAEPMSRSSIADFLKTTLDIPIRTGRFNDQALGIYKVESEVIRTKQANDIEVISHEIGHALQKFLFPESKTAKGLSSRPFSAYENELNPLATKPKAGQDVTPEGFAEFIRLYITDVKQAQAKAPAFFNYFESLLGNKAPEVRDIFLEARNRYDLYMKQPALKRVLSQISVGGKDPEKAINFDELYTKTIDDLHPLEVIVKEMAGGQNIPAGKDPYKLARLLRGWHGKAEAFLKNKPFDFDTYKDIPGAKSLKDILSPVRDNLDEFRAYIVSKRAIELDSRGIETGVLREDAEKLVRDYDKKYSAVFDQLKEFQDRTLNYLQQAGVLDPKAAEAMRQANQDYVPFYRVFEDQKNGGTGRGMEARNPVKAIKGSWRDIQDPLESIIKNTFLYINMAEKNAVGKALVDLSRTREGLGKFVEKIPTPTRGIEVKPEELQKWLKDVGLNESITPEMLDSESLMVFRPNAFMPKDNVIAVWNKGKRELYEVHPEVARVFQALDKESANTVQRLISLPANWLRAGATLTPEFIARNPLRDQWSGFINSKYGFIPGFDTVRAIFSMAKKDNYYWDWKKSGADRSMLVSLDRDYLQDNLGDILQKYPLVNVVKNPINGLRILSELGEAGTRIGEFRRGVQKEGQTKEGLQAAGFASREVTLDFGRVGAQTRAVNTIIAFWNAQVQGMDKTARQFRDDPLGTSVKVAASITLPSVLLAIANHDDPRYKEIPQWQKDLFWIVCTDKNVWRIPKPFELGILFGSVPERITNYILDKDPKAFKDTWETMKRGFSPGFYPTMLIPLTENWANKSMFFDRSIVPRSREELLPEYQYGEFTTETAKGLGRIIGKFPGLDRSGAASPAYIENLIRGWTGGLGKYALDIADMGLKAAGVTKKEYEEPSKTLADIPLIKAFSIRFPSSGSASIEEFYQNYEKTNQVNKTFKVLIEKERNPEAALRLMKESGMEDLNGIHKALGNMRNVVDLVYRNPSMTGDEKRQLIDTVYLQMIQVAKQGNVIHDQFEEYRKNNPKAAELRSGSGQ